MKNTKITALALAVGLSLSGGASATAFSADEKAEIWDSMSQPNQDGGLFSEIRDSKAERAQEKDAGIRDRLASFMANNPHLALENRPDAAGGIASRWLFGQANLKPPLELMSSDIGAVRATLEKARWQQDKQSLSVYGPLPKPRYPRFKIEPSQDGFMARRGQTEDLFVLVSQKDDKTRLEFHTRSLLPVMTSEMIKQLVIGGRDPYYSMAASGFGTFRKNPMCEGRAEPFGFAIECGKPRGAWANEAVPYEPAQYADKSMSSVPLAMLQPGYPTGKLMAQAGYTSMELTGYDLYAADDKLTAEQKLQVMRIWQTEFDGLRITALTGIFHAPGQVSKWAKSLNGNGCQAIYADDPMTDPATVAGQDIVTQLFPAVNGYYGMMAAWGKHPGYSVLVRCVDEATFVPPKPTAKSIAKKNKAKAKPAPKSKK